MGCQQSKIRSLYFAPAQPGCPADAPTPLCSPNADAATNSLCSAYALAPAVPPRAQVVEQCPPRAMPTITVSATKTLSQRMALLHNNEFGNELLMPAATASAAVVPTFTDGTASARVSKYRSNASSQPHTPSPDTCDKLSGRPAVPSDSWYATCVELPRRLPISLFHSARVGKVIFSTRQIGVDARRLDVRACTPCKGGTTAIGATPALKSSPCASSQLPVLPLMCSTFHLGSDLIYGMVYLHNTALFTEHQWRCRVSHWERVKMGALFAPFSRDVLQRRARHCESNHDGDAGANSARTNHCDPQPSSSSLGKFDEREMRVADGVHCTEAKCTSSIIKDLTVTDKEDGGGSANDGPRPRCRATKRAWQDRVQDSISTNRITSSSSNPGYDVQATDHVLVSSSDALDKAILCAPSPDMRLGLRVLVNNELVPDHYPGVRSLPQCTATLDVCEATRCWVMVPFVLVGFLNNMMLDPIAIYRTLSLSFVEYMLHYKRCRDPCKARSSAMSVASRTGVDDAASAVHVKAEHACAASAQANKTTADEGTKEEEQERVQLRVEVVYGCRSEAYFCTDFIAAGSCTLLITKRSKTFLKAYEEKLRALVKLLRSSSQIVRVRPRPMRRRSNVCRVGACKFCSSPLKYACTVCGAHCCGRVSCEYQLLRGYPRGCISHRPKLVVPALS